MSKGRGAMSGANGAARPRLTGSDAEMPGTSSPSVDRRCGQPAHTPLHRAKRQKLIVCGVPEIVGLQELARENDGRLLHHDLVIQR